MTTEAKKTHLTPEEAAELKLKKELTAKRTAQQRERRLRKKAAQQTASLLLNPTEQVKTIVHNSIPGKLFKSLFLEQLSRIEVGYTQTNAERIAAKVTKEAISGNLQAIELIMNRTDGKVSNQEDDSSRTTGLTIIAPSGQILIQGNPSSAPVLPPVSSSEQGNPEPVSDASLNSPTKQ